MHNTSERIIDLFGESNESPLFLKFIADLGEEPYILLNTEKVVEYDFARSGLHLSYRQVRKDCEDWSAGFAMAIFSLGRDYSNFEIRRAYSGTLPFGIIPDDSPETVKEKIAVEPYKTDYEKNSLKQNYSADGLEIWCSFRHSPLALTMLSLQPAD